RALKNRASARKARRTPRHTYMAVARAIAMSAATWNVFMVEALPNGRRLSCGAELEDSQTEFYKTASGGVSGSVGDGRRQLQARVRRLLSATQGLEGCLPARSDQ